MLRLIYIRTVRIGRGPGTGRLRRFAPASFEREAPPLPEPRNVTPRSASRRIPVRVRGDGWMDRARRALDRYGRRAGAWVRNVAGS